MTLIWRDKEAVREVEEAVSIASKKGAELVLATAKNNLIKNKSIKTGQLISSLILRKSLFKNGGYIVGVFGPAKLNWEDTMAAQAVFVEYGHAAPFKGRDFVKRSKVKKSVAARPFLMPALHANAKAIMKLFKDIV